MYLKHCFQSLIVFGLLLAACFAQQPPKFVFDRPDRIDLLKFTEDGKFLAAVTSRDFKIYDTASGEISGRLKSTHYANSAIFSKDGKFLITGNNDGKVRVWETANYSLLKTLAVTEWSIYSLAISADGRILGVDVGDGTIELWNLDEQKKVAAFGAPGQRMAAMNFSPDEKFFAGFNLQSELTVWKPATGEKIFSVARANQSPVTYCRKGRELAISDYSAVNFLDSRTGKTTRTLTIPKEIAPLFPRAAGMNAYFLGKVIVSPDCRTAAIGNWKKKTISLLDLKTAKVKKVLDYSASPETNYIVVFSPNGKLIAAGSSGGKIHIWQTE